jgi:hypothetical protein
MEPGPKSSIFAGPKIVNFFSTWIDMDMDMDINTDVDMKTDLLIRKTDLWIWPYLRILLTNQNYPLRNEKKILFGSSKLPTNRGQILGSSKLSDKRGQNLYRGFFIFGIQVKV